MVIKSLVFALIVYGIAVIITMCVAFIVKGIALILQKGGKSVDTRGTNQGS